ncbi:MAG TPA: AMP-binding protein, partial [Phenylobacterium sp.]|nr:AMP-binding protein [Phenylobacterium sp.]
MSRVLDAIAARAHAAPEAIAVSNSERAWTYGELAARVVEAADRLWALQAPPGAPVAVVLENGPAWVILDLALARLSRPSLPIPAFFTPDQRRHAMADCGAGLLLEPGEPADLRIAGVGLRATRLDLPPVRLPEGTAKITYTSGSTGRPKGVCLSQAQMEAVAASLVEVIGDDYAGRHLPLLPLSILLENVAGLYTTLLAGGRYHVLP